MDGYERIFLRLSPCALIRIMHVVVRVLQRDILHKPIDDILVGGSVVTDHFSYFNVMFQFDFVRAQLVSTGCL